MNVLILTSFWPTDQNPITGIFIQQQVRALQRAGCRVVVVAPQPWLRKSGTRALYDQSDGVSVYSPRCLQLPSRWLSGPARYEWNGYLCYLGISRVLQDLARNFCPDMVHVHGMRYLGFALPRIRHALNRPVVWTLHGEDAALAQDAINPRIQSLLQNSAATANRRTLVGSPLRSYVERLGLGTLPWNVIANGTDLPDVHQITHTFSGSRESEPLRILSVSNLVEVKGIDYNLRALALLRDEGVTSVCYHIIGDGVERGRLKQLVDALGLSGQVSFWGRLSYEATMSMMHECDIFSLPSWGEAFGIVYLEAMARGKPVIGCLTSGAADIVQSGHNGLLVNPRDSKAVAAALKRLITDRDYARRLGENALERVREFTWNANAIQFRTLYEQALAEAAPVTGCAA